MKRHIILLIILVLLPMLLWGQSLERSAFSIGVHGSTNTGQLSYTFGQQVIQTSSSSNGRILTQGFQQPDSTDFVSSIDVQNQLSMILFPSPVSSEAKLRLTSEHQGFADVQVFDAKGALVSRPLSDLIIAAGTTYEWDLNFSALSSGVYLLQLIDHRRGISQGLKFEVLR